MAKQKKNDEFTLSKKDYFAFMVVPPSGRTTYQIRITKRKLVWGVFSLMFVLLIGVAGISYGTKSTLDEESFSKLKVRAAEQEKQIERFEERVDAIHNTLKDLLNREEDMSKVIGRKKRQASRYSRRAKGNLFSHNFSTIGKDENAVTAKLNMQLDYIQNEIIQTESSLRQLDRQLAQYKDRFQKTPSIWPVFGYIRSRYGWRIHPKSGRRQFHKGIDIPAWIGAPVKATGDGVIEFAGWGGGYGWLIIINHEYGYRSLYAHLSEIMISPGRTVNKGQIIGKVGETGITTGPHIHYEIRRWTRTVHPNEYLNLDLFTALTKLW